MKLKLLILDIDGVLTDGTKYYDNEGNVVMKRFCDKDWTAIKQLRARGINVIGLTGDPFNIKILENRNIPCIVNRKDGKHTDKADYLGQIMETYGVSKENIAYIGDDLFDIEIMRHVGLPLTVNDAHPRVRQCAMLLECNGGENVVMHFVEFALKRGYLEKNIPLCELMGKIYKLDVEEKF